MKFQDYGWADSRLGSGLITAIVIASSIAALEKAGIQ